MPELLPFLNGLIAYCRREGLLRRLKAVAVRTYPGDPPDVAVQRLIREAKGDEPYIHGIVSPTLVEVGFRNRAAPSVRTLFERLFSDARHGRRVKLTGIPVGAHRRTNLQPRLEGAGEVQPLLADDEPVIRIGRREFESLCIELLEEPRGTARRRPKPKQSAVDAFVRRRVKALGFKFKQTGPDADAIRADCAREIGARYQQITDAFRDLPKSQRRKPGERDR